MEYIDIIKESAGMLAVNTRSISKVHISPEISDKVLENVEKAAKDLLSREYIIAILDSSLTGKGKEGIYFTGEKIVIKQMLEAPKEIYFSDIRNVEVDIREKIIKIKIIISLISKMEIFTVFQRYLVTMLMQKHLPK